MNRIAILALLLAQLACKPQAVRHDSAAFVKGVYGNPATLLEAGYSLDSLGVNAVFVRSVSLKRKFFDTAKRQGCQVFVEFPTLNGKEYLKEHPDAWPIDEKGENTPPADWFMGICPTHPGFREYRSEQLKAILREYAVDGIFLDYVHWHAQFETADPILPETCFCDRCTGQFASQAGIDIPETEMAERAAWILENADQEWRDWRASVLNGWVDDMGAIVKSLRPNAKLGVFYCAWYPDDHDSALYRTLGIDPGAFASRADVLAPMLFHRMKQRPATWVGEHIDWLGALTRAKEKGKPLIWPIVQAHNSPDVVTPGEFRQVLAEGSKNPASGVMMFSDQTLVNEPEKLEVMKTFYRKVEELRDRE